MATYYAVDRDGARFDHLSGPDGALAHLPDGSQVWVISDGVSPPEYDALTPEEARYMAAHEQVFGSRVLRFIRGTATAPSTMHVEVQIPRAVARVFVEGDTAAGALNYP